jgi:4-hydroxybenzoate polyprenyltransferase
MFRLLALLQLTRAALAFTAIADAWAILLLRPAHTDLINMGNVIGQMIAIAFASFGLYAFGMALNDLLDARRDRIFAPRRPIPSGRIRPRSAIVVALVLLMMALLASVLIMPLQLLVNIDHLRPSDFVPYSFMFALATAGLITFYDAASKYLGGVGLLTLGVIRAVHCLIGHPKTPLLFLAMILLTHVVIISTLAYKLENKRPRLHLKDYLVIGFGLVAGNAGALFYMYLRHALVAENFRMLIGPAVTGLVYVAWITKILLNKQLAPRQKGERIMLLGLFWLFVYDASILLANGQPLAGLAITLLLLCAICSFFTIRFLSRMFAHPRVDYRPERLPRPEQPKVDRLPT